ncbi:hypothetical protein [Microbacterium paraoxydans]|uniref:hypothetical protein n=1 Tax=Microbacterium paraoxydans TaxID=199592 RepID=UPI00046802D4|nr:hypothetical protein [Microbacterium paraoxydans]
MSTMEHTSAPADVTVTGVVSTAPVLTRLLPGRIPHVSFHLETPEAPGVNVHVDGSLAELAHLTIHRHDKVSVVIKRIYRANPHQITPDVDAEAFDLESRPHRRRTTRDHPEMRRTLASAHQTTTRSSAQRTRTACSRSTR